MLTPPRVTSFQGGKFGSGFASAGFGALASASGLAGLLNDGVKVRGVIVSAIVGGTGSRITGGKFSNGAVTGAFSYIFNSASRKDAQKGDEVDRYFEHSKEIALAKEISSTMPAKTREALQSILDSPVGDKIRASGVKIELALTLDVNNTFEVVDGIVYYHTDVKAHLKSPMGAGLPKSSTLCKVGYSQRGRPKRLEPDEDGVDTDTLPFKGI
ncbi:MAG: hypothetical protein COA42_14970 [Alteromonadaceae bacterium]|nr:MAG: hypothetical protein COA42_14970 [Alteromonadaceae bacterium]